MASPDAARSCPVVAWRPMRDDDLACVVAIEAQVHEAPWTIGNFRDSRTAGYATCVGECAGRILVYGVLMLGPGEAQLLNLSVAPDARRAGLGRALLRRFIADARRLGAEQLFLEVRPSNVAAIRLYETEGFVRVARRIAYYPPAAPGAPREDALVMRRALDFGSPPAASFEAADDHA